VIVNEDLETGERQVEVKLEGACPVCAGTLDARITPSGVWTYCSACHRLLRPRVTLAANGAMQLHPAAAA
jgi:hypothetical protein